MKTRIKSIYGVMLDMLLSAIDNDPKALQRMVEGAALKLDDDQYAELFGLVIQHLLSRGLKIDLTFENVVVFEME